MAALDSGLRSLEAPHVVKLLGGEACSLWHRRELTSRDGQITY